MTQDIRRFIDIRRILYALAIVAIVLGIFGFASRLFLGERDVGYGSYVNWGLWVAMYLFFAGLAAGSFMVASLDYLFRVELFKGTGRYALWATIVTLPAALVLIGLDLGHWDRIWKVYLQPNPNSLLAQLVWGYSVFWIVAIVALGLAARRSDLWLRAAMVVGLVLSLFVSGGVGALLGVNAGQVSFHTSMLPAQFPVLNLSAGIALMAVIVGFFGVVDPARRERLLRVLGLSLVALLTVKAYFLWVDYSQVIYSNVPDAVAVADTILFGQYSWAFWGLQVVLGLIVPWLLFVWPGTSQRPVLAGLAGVLVLLGLAVGRTAIIFPQLSVPDLEGLAEAFSHVRLSFDYVPSLVEWSVLVGVLGVATLAYLVGVDRLPLFKRRTEVAA
jgi:molybdopterin-containing oxidoreductase family membrane subunit